MWKEAVAETGIIFYLMIGVHRGLELCDFA